MLQFLKAALSEFLYHSIVLKRKNLPQALWGVLICAEIFLFSDEFLYCLLEFFHGLCIPVFDCMGDTMGHVLINDRLSEIT